MKTVVILSRRKLSFGSIDSELVERFLEVEATQPKRGKKKTL